MVEPKRCRDTNCLHPALREFVERAHDEIASLAVLETSRTPHRHAWLMRLGYTKQRALKFRCHPQVAKALSDTPEDAFQPTARAVTHTGWSRHIPGDDGLAYAVDIALYDGNSDDLTWNVTLYRWFVKQAQSLAREIGAKHHVELQNLGKTIGDWCHWQIKP